MDQWSFFSTSFKDASQKALNSQKLVLAVVHARAQDRIVVEAKKRPDAEVFVVSVENREELSNTLLKKALKFLDKP